MRSARGPLGDADQSEPAGVVVGDQHRATPSASRRRCPASVVVTRRPERPRCSRRPSVGGPAHALGSRSRPRPGSQRRPRAATATTAVGVVGGHDADALGERRRVGRPASRASSLVIADAEGDHPGHGRRHRGDRGHGAGAVPGRVADGVPQRPAAAAATAAPARPGPPAPAGSSRARPGSRAPAMRNSPPAPLAPDADAGDADTEQHQAEQRRPQRRRAVAAAAGQHRDDVLPRGEAGRHDGGQEGAEQAEAGDADAGAATAPRTARTSCREPLDAAAAAAAPTTDAEQRPRARRPTPPSTTAPAEDDPRACRGVPPVAAIRARLRCLPAGADRERRAGQQHHLEQGHHHDQHEHRDVRVVGAACRSCISGGSSEAGGGSAITARDATMAPMSLSSRTVAHETGPPSTSHASGRAGVVERRRRRAARRRRGSRGRSSTRRSRRPSGRPVPSRELERRRRRGALVGEAGLTTTSPRRARQPARRRARTSPSVSGSREVDLGDLGRRSAPRRSGPAASPCAELEQPRTSGRSTSATPSAVVHGSCRRRSLADEPSSGSDAWTT